ncbi:hypothetical protein MSG28_009545 [Choristoneura fumiferana]|uniref:Uncharacterized protein n=1 Tax=Choristoneura fumiferana TaxID=7141 RepID=A0ACC0JBI4_CHOFU|nr:hypothetical protein MSG28_009545 [Choristoneura fumiferana]
MIGNKINKNYINIPNHKKKTPSKRPSCGIDPSTLGHYLSVQSEKFVGKAASDAASALLQVPWRWEGASVSEQVASYTSTRTIFHGIKLLPFGLYYIAYVEVVDYCRGLEEHATRRLPQHAHYAPPLCSRDCLTKLTPAHNYPHFYCYNKLQAASEKPLLRRIRQETQRGATRLGGCRNMRITCHRSVAAELSVKRCARMCCEEYVCFLALDAYLPTFGVGSADGVGELFAFPPRENVSSYVTALEDKMLPSIRTVFPVNELAEFNYVHDNGPIHKARILNDWFHQYPKVVRNPEHSPLHSPLSDFELPHPIVSAHVNKETLRKETSFHVTKPGTVDLSVKCDSVKRYKEFMLLRRKMTIAKYTPAPKNAATAMTSPVEPASVRLPQPSPGSQVWNIKKETYISPMKSTLLGSVAFARFIANSPYSFDGFPKPIGIRHEPASVNKEGGAIPPYTPPRWKRSKRKLRQRR